MSAAISDAVKRLVPLIIIRKATVFVNSFVNLMTYNMRAGYIIWCMLDGLVLSVLPSISSFSTQFWKPSGRSSMHSIIRTKIMRRVETQKPESFSELIVEGDERRPQWISSLDEYRVVG
jgi:hypothetical protein